MGYEIKEFKGDIKNLDGVVFEMYPVGCCEHGCSSCCANAMMIGMTGGAVLCCAPQFTMNIAKDGKSGVGTNATLCGCWPMSPLGPCCPGIGPFAFVSPFKIVDEGNGNSKWVGNGQICKGGCCPCMVNTGDYGFNKDSTDGSTADKYHDMFPVSPFWPPCVNGMCCGKDKPAFRMTQKGVGKPVVKKGGAAPVEMER